MEWLNYNHLFYFWSVAREGTIAAAGAKLSLAQPTISAQIRRLETSLGTKLFARSGRTLVLTETGRVVHRYAEEIFALGRELQDVVKGRPVGSPIRFNVGVVDVLPKLVAYRLLAPAMSLPEPVHVSCFEGKASDLLGRLAVHELDLVLADAPIAPEVKVRAYNHDIGECGVTVFGIEPLATRYRDGFPGSLDGAPFLLPTANTTIRRALDGWFDRSGLRPLVTGEFEDSALLKVFGEEGVGLFTAPTVIEDEVVRQYRVQVVGHLPEVRERYYAISVERQVKHPAVRAMVTAAKGLLSGEAVRTTTKG